MMTVTMVAKIFRQPPGGFLPQTQMERIQMDDGVVLAQEENIDTRFVGLAVDYLSRFYMGATLEESFMISLRGANKSRQTLNARKLLFSIKKDLDDNSIINACKLVGYDDIYRGSSSEFVPIDLINPNSDTINNIRIMVKRSKIFFEKYGPIVLSGFKFEGGYSAFVSNGDGDFLTKDTLWEFKVLKKHPESRYTLQLLMYYIMGKRSIHKEFKDINKIGIFNPRKNLVYLYDMENFDQELLTLIADKVVGYNTTQEEFWRSQK